MLGLAMAARPPWQGGRLPHARPPHAERGITGIETAIILVSFVVVAAVFAFVALSTGLFSSERARESVFAGVGKARGSLYLSGGVIVASDSTQVTSVELTVALAAGGESVDLDPADGAVITVISPGARVADVTHTIADVMGDGDDLLEPGELMAVTLDLTAHPSVVLTANTTFTIEIKPEGGANVVVRRTLPASLAQAVIDLD